MTKNRTNRQPSHNATPTVKPPRRKRLLAVLGGLLDTATDLVPL